MASTARHRAVTSALRNGMLQRQPCEVCGMRPEPHIYGGWNVVAHHDDPEKLLDVRWLCRQHHADYHKKQGAYVNNGRVYRPRASKIALSERQAEVLQLYRANVPVIQIADLLGISTQRVYQHVDRLRELGVIR